MKFVNMTMLLCGIFISLFEPAEGCTRVLFTGSDNVVITGRSMDWKEDMYTDLWVFPKGIKRDGSAGPKSINWTSKYGSLVSSVYNLASVDGMNEKGLVANVLYLVESDYGKSGNEKSLLSVSLWGQYVLDNFATVSEAVESLSQNPFRIVGLNLPNGVPANVHLSLSDSIGDSAIFQYLEGKLVIYHGKQYTVMTNSPSFDKQLALNAYWEAIGGLVFLPGTNRSADRFARASFLLGAIPKEASPKIITAVPHKDFTNQALASVLGVIRSVSVPLGITTPNEPNIASTLWRTVSDQTNRVYCFDSATSPNVFWVQLSDLDFTEGAQIKKLPVAGGKIYSGNTAAKFEAAQPFTFISATP